jgi:hypothetical protein
MEFKITKNLNKMIHISKLRKFMDFTCATTLLIVTFMLAGCANSPAKTIRLAFLEQGEIVQSIFKHRVLILNHELEVATLAIFIEGDGLPWINEKHIAKDPTGSTPLMLQLMNRYKEPAIYIGRPCYYQVNDPKCHHRYWTSHRYSELVVKSITNIIATQINSRAVERLILIGHSGGGVIASLVACRLKPPTRLVTISANLDIDEWTKHHEWTPLKGSINPANDSSICSHTTQRHLHGAKDKQTPMNLNTKYYERHHIKPIIIENANHSNWLQFWPQILDEIK